MKPPFAFLPAVLAAVSLRAAEPALDASALPALPPAEPAAASATFDLDPEFRAELVASEPHVASPVALAFDENGVLFVVGMRDYSERREERLGRVTRLEDRDEDGEMDHATVFADGLPWPTGVLCFDGGVFVVAAPDLWFFKDTDGDGVADERRVVLTGFSELTPRLNVQQLPNSLRWGPDQRVYVAEGGNGSRVRQPGQGTGEGLELRGRDLSFDPRTLDLRAESGGGQNGMAFDDFGRRFVSSNSRHLMQVAYDFNLAGGLALALPPSAADIAVDGPAAPVFRRSPDEAWRVIRTRWRLAGVAPGPIEGGGRPSGYFTGATGVQIYRGDLFPQDYQGNAFIADCGSNLIHRKRLRPAGSLLRGERPAADEGREFLASTDNWFRPVQLENGPSGGLYVIDFYREIIEHPWSLPPNIKQHLDLNRGHDRGRIWRIVPKAAAPRRGRAGLPGGRSVTELAALLAHPNGWHRDTAARLLFERDSPEARALMRDSTSASSVHLRLAALNLLAAWDELTSEMIARGLRDSERAVRERALLLTRRLRPDPDWNASPWRELALELMDGVEASASGFTPESIGLTLALALSRAKLDEEMTRVLWRKLTALRADPFFDRAVASLAAPHADALLLALAREGRADLPPSALANLAQAGAKSAAPNTVAKWLQHFADSPDSDLAMQHSRLVSLATGVAREPALVRNLRLADAVRERIAEAAGRALTRRAEDAPADWPLGSLALVGTERAARALLPVIESAAAPAATRLSAVETLLRLGETEVLGALLDRWQHLPPAARERVLVTATRSAAGMEAVISRAAADAVLREQLGPSFRQTARTHAVEEIRRRALGVFGESSSATITQRRAALSGALTIPGAAARGRIIFQVRCASCHRAGEEGFVLGPDLLTVAGAGRETLLNNILDPNREVAPRFEAWTVTTRDGEEVTGLLAVDEAQTVSVRMASGVEASFKRAEIASFTSAGRSLMPEGLDEGLDAGEMADLLRFIEALVQP